MSNHELLLKLFLQLAAILVVCRIVGYLGKRFFGQSEVVCEMVAGILLGPSLLGLLAPEFQRWLFPQAALVLADGQKCVHPSKAILSALSNIGLVLYMFLTGLELDVSLLRRQARSAAVVSGAGLIAPFALGIVAAWLISGNKELLPEGANFTYAAMFFGASMAVTSLPMLARMLKERGLSKTEFGTLGIAAASIDDLAAWCLLALVLAGMQSSINVAAVTIGGGVLYIVLVLVVGRPLLMRFEREAVSEGGVSTSMLSAVFVILMLAAWFTAYVEIDAVFGAFWLGMTMPRGEFAKHASKQLEHVTTALLLPVFFANSGLSTQIGLLKTPMMWAIAAMVVALAIFGKGAACMFAARGSGWNWRDSAVIGAMMNTRGLMGLIILNIGLQHGLITPVLFTIMVLMALLTTIMCSPLLNALGYGPGAKVEAE